MRILIATDVFPPRCGGSGWSAFHLATALAERGHQVAVARPDSRARADRQEEYGGLPVHVVGAAGWNLPLGRAWPSNQGLWSRFGRALAAIATDLGADLIHGQHQQSVPAAAIAAELVHRPVVSTVRDYWPRCYYSTLVRRGRPCSGCSVPGLADCLSHHTGLPRPATLALVPYGLRVERRRAAALAGSARVIAVSRHVAATLDGLVPSDRLTVIPNLVDTAWIAAVVSTPPSLAPPPGPFALFVGKLEANKAPLRAVEAVAAAGAPLPLVVAGDGSQRELLERAAARLGVRVKVRHWLDHDEVLRLMARATALVFPSGWDEPLSRVLLEAQAVGLPSVAAPTGGTPDIITNGVNGLLATGGDGLGRGLAQIAGDAGLRGALSAGARKVARSRFEKDVVVPRMEAVYREAIEATAHADRAR